MPRREERSDRLASQSGSPSSSARSSVCWRDRKIGRSGGVEVFSTRWIIKSGLRIEDGPRAGQSDAAPAGMDEGLRLLATFE